MLMKINENLNTREKYQISLRNNDSSQKVENPYVISSVFLSGHKPDTVQVFWTQNNVHVRFVRVVFLSFS